MGLKVGITWWNDRVGSLDEKQGGIMRWDYRVESEGGMIKQASKVG